MASSEKRNSVLLVGPVPPPFGGIAKYVEDLYESSLDSFDLLLFNTSLPNSVASHKREGDRTYQNLYENGLWAAFKKVAYVILSFFVFAARIIIHRPQIVQVFSSTYWGYWRSWLYILIAKLMGRKTIFHILGAIDLFHSEVGEGQRRWIERSLCSADLYLLQSPELEHWVKQYSDKQVRGLWNGIHLDRIPQKQTPAPENLQKINAPVGVTIGNLSRNKGTYTIIKALEILKNKSVQVGWVFIGRGDIEAFNSLAEKSELENLHFVGIVDDQTKWHYLYHSDFFCLPSYAEGQPISILEAMAVGLPIISSTVGSIPEVITEGMEGLLVEPGDEVALAQAIEKLVLDAPLRNTMSKNVLSTVKARHDITILFDSMREEYEKLLSLHN